MNSSTPPSPGGTTGPEFSRSHSELLRRSAQLGSDSFPKHKLKKGNGKGPRIVLVACGSFSPITYMHVRLFEQMKDYGDIKGLNIVGGYFSPVTDAYAKKGLAPAVHRVKMAELACESSNWIMVDHWESKHSTYQTTIIVLDHFNYCLNKDLKEGEEPYQIRLICGADLLDSFNKPGVWAPEDIREIVLKYGIMVLERSGSNAAHSIYENDTLFELQNHVHIVPQYIMNDISSTKMRQNIQRGLSIKYLTPDSVIKYIEDNKLYNKL